MSFKDLHKPGDPLLLPNAWDVASAAALAAAGFPAIGTTSLGVAAAAGIPDATGGAWPETLALAQRLARLDVYVTVDMEHGFSDDPAEVAEYAARLDGIAGDNLEDRHGDPRHHAQVIAAAKARAPHLFVNARTDTHWLGVDRTDTVDRLRAYVDAGADGVFVPGLVADRDVAVVVAGVPVPVNVLFLPGRTNVRTMVDLGVRRVSTGSFLFRAALGAALDAARSVRRGSAPVTYEIPTYQQVQDLVP
jgi:2-methylisocitrate lyase-like PEP mutase family enzyme